MFDTSRLVWTREPASCSIGRDRVEIVTRPHTDLWQRTYYHFRNDTAPVLQAETEEEYFTFTVRTDFETRHRFDQCGVAVYLDSENWLKAGAEYEDGKIQHLGSVVTRDGWSDWATTDLDAGIRTIWYRLSRRRDDWRLESSLDGVQFAQMRICHLPAEGPVRFGLCACSPEDSSFRAVFTCMDLGECLWPAHDGQPPDPD